MVRTAKCLVILLALLPGAVPASGTLAASPDGSPTLNIPGLGSIPLPPGTRSFGPEGMQGHAPNPGLSAPAYQSPGVSRQLPDPGRRDLGAAPAPPKPVAPKGRDALLDELFSRLRNATEADEAEGIASAIQRIWLRSGSDTAELLMGRALKALSAHDTDLCLSILDKVIELNPDWAEGWNKRATIRYISADYAGAMEDIAHVLAIEPRHFGALAGMGYIFQKMERNKQALSVFRKVLEIYPQQDDIRKAVEKMAPDVDGRDI